MAPRAYLNPKVVTEIMRELLEKNPLLPVTYQNVADELQSRGITSPRTQSPFSRQRVAQILTHPRNQVGQRLVAESHRRARTNPLYAGLSDEEEVTDAHPVAGPAVPSRLRRAGRSRR